MRKHIKVLVTHPLISGSAVIFGGTLLANIVNFAFNLYMSRNLRIDDYGILVSAVSLITLLTIPIGSLVPTLVNFAGTYMENKEYGAVKSLYVKAMKIVFSLGVILVILFAFFINQIQSFFHINNPFVIVVTGLIVLVSYFSIINTGLLQSKLSFKFLSFLHLSSAIIKIVLSICLVTLGYGLGGVMVAIFIAFFTPYIIGFIKLPFLFKVHSALSNNELRFKDLMHYGIPSAIAMFGLAALTSTDILLVKHFYSPMEAGFFAGLSLIGKVIFFITAPIGTVMFPLIVKKVAKNESYRNTFRLAFIIVLSSSLCVTLFYYLFPEFSIHFFLKNPSYISIKGYLSIYALFMTLYSLVTLLVYYFLSINKTKVYIPVAVGALTQMVLITMYHQSFLVVISISLSITSVLLIMLGSYYLWHND